MLKKNGVALLCRCKKEVWHAMIESSSEHFSYFTSNTLKPVREFGIQIQKVMEMHLTMPSVIKPLSHQGGVLTATARRARKTQNAEVRAVRSPRAPRDRRGIAVASPLDAVGSPRTPCHGAHFVHAQSARRCSAFPRRSEWAPCERSQFAAATQ